jgi:divalent metal cation (Fe/Co/Zn/Cd) transporter
VWAGGVFHVPFLKYADPVAALGVAAIVVQVSLRLGRETIDSLLDAAPKGMREKIEKEVSAVPGVLQVADIRIRPSGAFYYVDVSVGIDPNLSQKMVQRIVLGIKERVATVAERCDVIVGTFPASVGGTADTGVTAALESIVESMPNCENVHNMHVYELGGKKRITAHVELTENLTLRESHELSHKISAKMQQAVPSVDYVNLYFQRAQQGIETQEVTSERKDLADNIRSTVERLGNSVDCHEVRLFKSGKAGVSAFLHCGVPEDFRMDKLESLSSAVKTELRSRLPELDHVHIHFEPADEE